jgi:hypothetical protein
MDINDSTYDRARLQECITTNLAHHGANGHPLVVRVWILTAQGIMVEKTVFEHHCIVGTEDCAWEFISRGHAEGNKTPYMLGTSSDLNRTSIERTVSTLALHLGKICPHASSDASQSSLFDSSFV